RFASPCALSRSSAMRWRHARKFVRSVAKKNELLTQSSSCCVSALFSTICTVHYERDESGWWVAQVKEVPAAITQGRAIVESRRRIRKALALAMDNDRKAAKARLVGISYQRVQQLAHEGQATRRKRRDRVDLARPRSSTI